MTQTLALLVDAYRDLNSRKLFWLVLILSTLFAGSFACVAVVHGGVTIFGWRFPYTDTGGTFTNAVLQKKIFFYFGVDIWLTWIASILAIISTAGIFPSLITGGTIELFLSKPISRFRLFLTKYFFGLLFVALQIACYCVASFLVIGLRGRSWEPAIFLAIPIVVLFYSYLHCVCVLFGVMTRSTVAAILLTLLFWMIVWVVAFVEKETLVANIFAANRISMLDRQTENSGNPAATMPSTRRSADRSQGDDLQNTDEQWHKGSLMAETFLPKTTATIELLHREMIARGMLPAPPNVEGDFPDQNDGRWQDIAEEKAEAEIRNRPLRWTIGTSLAFEAGVLLLAAWIFCRRDY